MYPGWYPGQGTRQSRVPWVVFRVTLEGTLVRSRGGLESTLRVRLTRPHDSIGVSNPNASVSNYQITNIEKASSRAWFIAAIFAPLFFSPGPSLALLREREREGGTSPFL